MFLNQVGINWNHGRRCPICPAKQSKFEKDVRKFFE